MPNWLDRWLHRPTAAATLADRLRGYPPYAAPHRGHGTQLTEAQARENLAYLLAVRDERIAAVASLLQAEAGIDVVAALGAPAAQLSAFTAALHAWSAERWPALQAQRPWQRPDWLASTRQGEDIVYSMLMDLGIVLGELVLRHAADWRWDVDLDPQNLRDDMATARRVVLLADAVGSAPAPFVVDVEAAVAGVFLNPPPGLMLSQRLNDWGRIVHDAIRGAHQAAFLADAAAQSRGRAETPPPGPDRG